MGIVLKRHYKLLILLIVLMIALLSVGETRVISYNFGEGSDIKNYSQIDYENDVYLFDDSIIHEINIDLSQEDYENMIELYQETGEKEYYKTNVTIDGVTVYDVGVRLKGNLTLRQAIERENVFNKEEYAKSIPQKMEIKDIQLVQNGSFRSTNKNPPFLIKIDKFVEGQTYQGFAEVALRIGSDESLLAEPITFYIHQQVGQIVSETSYAVVETAGNDCSLYVLCEHIDEKYVQKYFPGSDGILYKAKNFAGFEYLGNNPTLYSEKFEQKTKKSDDDLFQLIQFMKFVAQSSDEKFEEELGDWIDLESFIRMMALDNLLSNSDSFFGMGSNYYLYFNKNAEQFAIISWDMNLATGPMMGGMDRNNNKGGYFMGGSNSVNLLKERFFGNDNFLNLYNKEYSRLEDIIFTQNFVIEKIEKLAQIFTDYNSKNRIVNQNLYDLGVENIKNFIEEKQFLNNQQREFF